ncbi:MAG: pitrilysin family protein [Anaerolineae bacterium]
MITSLPSAETIVRAELPNGITLLTFENPDSPSVVIGGYLWAGSISETAEQAGLSSLTAGMLMRGTGSRTFGQINDALESVGAQLGYQSNVHSVGFGGKALAEDLDLLLDILADSLQHPTFPEAELEKLRGQVLTAIQRRAHDTSSMAWLTFDALLYPDHPYGRSIMGYEETVSGLGRAHLLNYYRDLYSPEGMVVAVVGAVPPDTVLDKVRSALGGWRAPDASPNVSIPPNVRLDATRRDTVFVEGKSQSNIVLGWPALARNDPDYMKAHLANTVLGVFGMMGRLGENIRERQGLAYYAYSRLQAGLGAGPWTAVAGVNPANVERAVEGILDEARRLRDEPLPQDELADSQSYLTGTMPLRLETNEGVLNALLDIERHELGLDYLLRYTGLVQAVTVDHIQEIAQKYLNPDVYALAVAGPERAGE